MNEIEKKEDEEKPLFKWIRMSILVLFLVALVLIVVIGIIRK